MTELIVALDQPTAVGAKRMFERLWNGSRSIQWFKIGPGVLLTRGGSDLCETIANQANLFLDLKIYDTRDTVERIARRAFNLGARFLTVHATPSMLEAAMRAKPPGDYCKVLAVGKLTDGAGTGEAVSPDLFDGMIIPVTACAGAKAVYYDKLIVCPGIRPVDNTGDYIERHNHVHFASPSEARAAGADYIVVGRPIYDAPDPVAAARAIMGELG